jgi:hypothetical protein
MTPLFETGKIVAAPGALNLFTVTGTHPLDLLGKHTSGDWGDVPLEDAKENQFSIENGFRLMSSYCVGDERIWVITEADRSSTCILRPEEY